MWFLRLQKKKKKLNNEHMQPVTRMFTKPRKEKKSEIKIYKSVGCRVNTK